MNILHGAVRKQRGEKTDARVERTKRALGSALVELMLERHFDTITVQAVLDRAGVGRATFYAHFRNKRDLFLSDYERMLDALEAHLARDPMHRARVAPVAEFFRHVGEAQTFIEALRASGQLDLVWEIGAAHFAKMIERRLKLLSPETLTSGLTRVLASKFCAGALIEMLRWWLDRDARPTPEQMDEIYHQMVRKAVGIPHANFTTQ